MTKLLLNDTDYLIGLSAIGFGCLLFWPLAGEFLEPIVASGFVGFGIGYLIYAYDRLCTRK